MVADVLMPPIGEMLADVDADGKVTPAVMISYGKFINTVIDFVTVAFCISMNIQAMKSL